jgi:type VI protein secretion system component Hcp
VTSGLGRPPRKRRRRFSLGRVSGGLVATPLAVTLVLALQSPMKPETVDRPVTLLAENYEIYVSFHDLPDKVGYSLASSVSDGVSNPAQLDPNGRGIVTGVSSFSNATIVKGMDAASAGLITDATQGRGLYDVTIRWAMSINNQKKVVLQETLSNAAVVAYQAGGPTNNYMETVSIAFSCLRKDYRTLKLPGGETDARYTSQWNAAAKTAGPCGVGRPDLAPGVVPFESP